MAQVIEKSRADLGRAGCSSFLCLEHSLRLTLHSFTSSRAEEEFRVKSQSESTPYTNILINGMRTSLRVRKDSLSKEKTG